MQVTFIGLGGHHHLLNVSAMELLVGLARQAIILSASETVFAILLCCSETGYSYELL